LKLKSAKTAGLLAILVAVILAVGLLSLGCSGGTAPSGWGGGLVQNGVIYLGSNNGQSGQLVALSVADNNTITGTLRAEPLKARPSSGLFGCSPTAGCSSGTVGVPIYGTPAVSDNVAYVAGYNGKVYAYNTSNMAVRWLYPKDRNLKPFVGGPVIAQGKLFIGCQDGYVYSFDANTGELLSKFKTGGKIWGTPAVDGNTLYIGSFDKYLYAINISDLTLKWKFDSKGSIIATPTIVDGVVYFGSFDKHFYALNATDGSLVWKFTAESWFWDQAVVVNGVVYTGCLDDHIYVLDAASGNQLASFVPQDKKDRSPFASSPVLVGNDVLFASKKGAIYKVNTTTHEFSLLRAFTSLVVESPLFTYNGILYIHVEGSVLERVNLSDGSILQAMFLQN
jgi:outer membrane protein assembly factor BamB